MGSNQSKPGKNGDKNTNNNNHELYPHVPPFNVTDYTSSAYPYPTDNFMFSGPVYSTPATAMGPINAPGMPHIYPSASAPPAPSQLPYIYPSASAPPAPSQLHVEVHELDGHSNITRPPPPPRVRHLSELIDPMDIPANTHVRSPSGNVLDAEEWAAHPMRPRSLRERREEILRRVAEVNAAYRASEGVGDAPRAAAAAGAGAGDVEDVDRIEVLGDAAGGRAAKRDKVPKKKEAVSKDGGEGKGSGGGKKAKRSRDGKGLKKADKGKGPRAAKKAKEDGFWRSLVCF